jgi:hypothetical protein
VCSRFIFLHREKAKASAADSAINTEVESCMKALIKNRKRRVICGVDYENAQSCKFKIVII